MNSYSAPVVLLGFLFLLTALFLFIPLEIRITIDNLRHDKSISGQLVVLWGGKVKFGQAKIAFPAILGPGPFSKKSIAFFVREDGRYKRGKIYLQGIAGALNRLLIHTCVWERLDLQVRLGVGDPARTALLIGFLRFLLGWGLPYTQSLLVFKNGNRPRFLFYPYFPGNKCIFLLSAVFKINSLKFIYQRIRILNSIKMLNRAASVL